MRKEHKVHLFHYFVLFLILAIGFVFFIYLKPYPLSQFLVIVVVDFLYLCWGIIHHYLEERLSWGVVTEYLLISVVVLLAFGVTINLR